MLRSHIDYYVKVRAYSVSNVAMETDWIAINGMSHEEKDSKCTHSPSSCGWNVVSN